MWIISLFLSFPFQNSKTPVIFLDKPHLFPLLSPTTQGFEIAHEDALDDKPVPVSTSKPESFVLNPHSASHFLCSKSHPFLSSWNLFFLLVFFSHLLLFFCSILSNSLYIWSISTLAFLFTFTAILLKIISLLLRHYSTHSRLDSVTKISPK